MQITISLVVECPPPNWKVWCSIHGHWATPCSAPSARAFRNRPDKKKYSGFGLPPIVKKSVSLNAMIAKMTTTEPNLQKWQQQNQNLAKRPLAAKQPQMNLAKSPEMDSAQVWIEVLYVKDKEYKKYLLYGMTTITIILLSYSQCLWCGRRCYCIVILLTFGLFQRVPCSLRKNRHSLWTESDHQIHGKRRENWGKWLRKSSCVTLIAAVVWPKHKVFSCIWVRGF